MSILKKVTFNSLTANNIHHQNDLKEKPKRKVVKVVRCYDGLCASVRPACDWSNTNILLANKKTEKRKAEIYDEDNCDNTKKRRPGTSN